MKKKSLPALKKKLWTLVSKYIRLHSSDKDGYVKCVTCDKRMHWKESHAGHYVPKSKGLSIYFYEKNIHPQCPHCNIWKHGALDEYALWLIKTYGEGILEELNQKKNEIIKLTADDYEAMIDQYKQKIKLLEND